MKQSKIFLASFLALAILGLTACGGGSSSSGGGGLATQPPSQTAGINLVTIAFADSCSGFYDVEHHIDGVISPPQGVNPNRQTFQHTVSDGLQRYVTRAHGTTDTVIADDTISVQGDRLYTVQC